VKRSIAIAIASMAMLATMAPTALAQSPDEGAEIYGNKCARCHQDDGLGVPGKYPPLAGNPDATDLDWVTEVVTNGLSGKVIMGVTYEREMRGFEGILTPEEIQLVSAYAVELALHGASTPTDPSTPDPAPPITETSASVGDNLFSGSTRLASGGPACIACHAAGEYDRLGGPGMAIDLNGIVDDYGESGFIDSIIDPIVPGMIAVFADQPISDQEAADLAAFLATTTADTTDDYSVDLLGAFGIVGFLILILITALVIRGPQQTYVSKLRSKR